jgi:hypothetical protein
VYVRAWIFGEQVTAKTWPDKLCWQTQQSVHKHYSPEKCAWKAITKNIWIYWHDFVIKNEFNDNQSTVSKWGGSI